MPKQLTLDYYPSLHTAQAYKVDLYQEATPLCSLSGVSWNLTTNLKKVTDDGEVSDESEQEYESRKLSQQVMLVNLMDSNDFILLQEVNVEKLFELPFQQQIEAKNWGMLITSGSAVTAEKRQEPLVILYNKKTLEEVSESRNSLFEANENGSMRQKVYCGYSGQFYIKGTEQRVTLGSAILNASTYAYSERLPEYQDRQVAENQFTIVGMSSPRFLQDNTVDGIGPTDRATHVRVCEKTVAKSESLQVKEKGHFTDFLLVNPTQTTRAVITEQPSKYFLLSEDQQSCTIQDASGGKIYKTVTGHQWKKPEFVGGALENLLAKEKKVKGSPNREKIEKQKREAADLIRFGEEVGLSDAFYVISISETVSSRSGRKEMVEGLVSTVEQVDQGMDDLVKMVGSLDLENAMTMMNNPGGSVSQSESLELEQSDESIKAKEFDSPESVAEAMETIPNDSLVVGPAIAVVPSSQRGHDSAAVFFFQDPQAAASSSTVSREDPLVEIKQAVLDAFTAYESPKSKGVFKHHGSEGQERLQADKRAFEGKQTAPMVKSFIMEMMRRKEGNNSESSFKTILGRKLSLKLTAFSLADQQAFGSRKYQKDKNYREEILRRLEAALEGHLDLSPSNSHKLESAKKLS